MAERVYIEVGEEHQYDQQKRGEISPGELRHSGMCNTIREDISTTRHLGHIRRVLGSGENDSGDLFASSYLLKDQNHLTHFRSSK